MIMWSELCSQDLNIIHDDILTFLYLVLYFEKQYSMLFTLVAKHLTQIEVNLFCSEPEAKSQPGEFSVKVLLG